MDSLSLTHTREASCRQSKVDWDGLGRTTRSSSPSVCGALAGSLPFIPRSVLSRLVAETQLPPLSRCGRSVLVASSAFAISENLQRRPRLLTAGACCFSVNSCDAICNPSLPSCCSLAFLRYHHC